MPILALCIYTFAMTVANLTVSAFGPAVAPINAFILIGLDLALRDWLHVRLRKWQMAALIVGASLLSFVLDPSTGRVAASSAAAFFCAALADWAVFSGLKGTWTRRSLWSNVAGAAVDSLLFLPLAFGGFPAIAMGEQGMAKIAGGAVWTWLLKGASPMLASEKES